jgi:hypothetical protein
MYRSVHLASSLAAALLGEMRVLARRGGRVRTEAVLSILKLLWRECHTKRSHSLVANSQVVPQPARSSSVRICIDASVVRCHQGLLCVQETRQL